MSGRHNAQTTRVVRGAGTTALALAIGVLPVFALMPGASAKGSTGGGNNAKGSLTIHNATGTTILDQNNEPHVCAFRVVADNYDPTKYRGISYTFSRIAPSKPVADGLYPGTITLSVPRSNGTIGGQTDVLTIPNGHYKPHGQLIELNGSLENGQDNFKAFWVNCASTPPTTPPPTTAPPVTETTPPVTQTTPPVTETTPPVTETTPPVTETTPPVTQTTPPVTETTPPVTETTPPVTETTPPVTDTTPPVTDTNPPTTGGGDITGGGGTTTTTGGGTTTHPVTGGGGTVTSAKTLPFTGSNTGALAVWGLSSLVAGAGLVLAGNRRTATR